MGLVLARRARRFDGEGSPWRTSPSEPPRCSRPWESGVLGEDDMAVLDALVKAGMEDITASK
jgi:hypothetical protein